MLKRIPFFGKLSASFIILALFLFFVSFFLERIDFLAGKSNLRIVFTIIIAIVLSCASAWLFIKLFIKKPFLKIFKGMNKLVEQDFNFRLDESGLGEFRSLASSFNDMASRLVYIMSELKKNRDYLEGIVESTVDIIVTVSSSGKILTINAGAEKALGYLRHEIIGKPIEILFTDPHERRKAIEKLNYADNVVNYETRFLTKTGEIRDVLLSISRLKNSDGEIIATIGISKDITEEKRLQNLLIQTQRLAAIGEVFTGVQHYLKNMLNSCTGGAYMVKLGLSKDDRKLLEEGWGIVQEGISRMTAVSLAMLKYVKEWKPKFERVEMSQIFSQIDRVIKSSAKEKGIKFQMNVPPDLPSVLCDSRMIHSVVLDIVSNALDACTWKEYQDGDAPEIVLGAFLNTNKQQLIIEVKDNGCGMTEEVKKNIFTPFFSMKSKAGTGLGLSISSRMIEAHKGNFDVQSKPNFGTTFRIVLPIDRTNKNEVIINGEKSFSN